MKISLLGRDLDIYVNPKLDIIESMSNKNDYPVYRKIFAP